MHGEVRNTSNVLIRKLDGKRPLGRQGINGRIM
jgi:hypothetical protein